MSSCEIYSDWKGSQSLNALSKDRQHLTLGTIKFVSGWFHENDYSVYGEHVEGVWLEGLFLIYSRDTLSPASIDLVYVEKTKYSVFCI